MIVKFIVALALNRFRTLSVSLCFSPVCFFIAHQNNKQLISLFFKKVKSKEGGKPGKDFIKFK